MPMSDAEAKNIGQAKACREMPEFNTCAVIVAHPDDETLLGWWYNTDASGS